MMSAPPILVVNRYLYICLAEDHRLAPVDQHPLFGDPAHRARQHLRLDIAAGADQIVDRLAMIDALDRLFDDRPFIEVAGYEMCVRADHLYPSFILPLLCPPAL